MARQSNFLELWFQMARLRFRWEFGSPWYMLRSQRDVWVGTDSQGCNIKYTVDQKYRKRDGLFVWLV